MRAAIFCIVALTIASTSAAEPAIIPRPASVRELAGAPYTLHRETMLVVPAFSNVAARFAAELETPTGIRLGFGKPTEAGAIGFVRADNLPAGGYRLNVRGAGIVIEAADEAGAFHATRTLLQLLPPAIFATTRVTGVAWTIPAVTIEDAPRFAWRGFMLDVSRHFFGPEEIRRQLDLMALHKLNIFHWHLSDDQGWTVEIRKHPELTQKAGTRGFYTQQQIRELVAYAAERHITIVPEIDAPGHSRAAAMAVPGILCAGTNDSKSVQGVAGNVWCVGREENYALLDDVYAELAELFPGPWIHLGGDEVNRNAWKDCPRCQALMRDKGYKDPGDLQNHFVGRVADLARKHGRSVVGWNEVLHGHLATSAVVMAWTSIDPGYTAARRGHPVVMAPGGNCYLDMKESRHDTFGHWWAGLVSLDKVYALEPFDRTGLTAAEQQRLFGVQACLWTEYVTNSAALNYKIWPRLLALAEVGWTPQARRDFVDFRSRLGPALQRLSQRGVPYRVPEASAKLAANQVVIEPPFGGADIRFTTDGATPDASSPKWSDQTLDPAAARKLKTVVVAPDGRLSHVNTGVEAPPADRAGTLTPSATVETAVPAYGDSKPDQIVDWKPKTFFWSSRKGQAGDTITIRFAQPVALKHVEIPTGKLNSPTEDCVVDADLQVSRDGTNFETVAGFAYGTARADLDGRPVSALRIAIKADHDTWLIVQDPLLR